MAKLLSVNVGLPKDVSWGGRTVHTGIWKRPVAGPVLVRRLNIDGDGQGDLAGHGGEMRAVLVYQRESIEYWREQLGLDLDAFGPPGSFSSFGSFGENFTVDGLSDDEVCVGDRYRIGGAEFEVSQPRVTCYRVGLRLGVPALPELLVAQHRPGFYLRVITEGPVQAGDEIVRTRRGRHEMSIAEIDALLYLPGRNRQRLRQAADIPALSPGWQGSFRDLLAAPGAPGAGTEPGWRGFRPMRVTALTAESSTITSVRLAPAAGDRLPAPQPGQYLTLRVPQAGDPAPVRSYSLSSAPADDTYRISVKRDGLVSSYLLTHLRVGATIEVAAPRGDFVLAAGREPVLLISAGVGVTPVLAMLQTLAAERSTRQVWWLQVAHDPGRQAFAEEARRLLAALPESREHIFFTATGGRPSAAAFAALGLPAEASAYLCGPQSFMDDVRRALTDLGLDPARLHTELFGARPSLNPGVVGTAARPPHQPAGEPGSGPAVTFARSGLTVRWQEARSSLLTLAEACDVPTRWSCRTGVCHNCVTPVLSGDVVYGPEPLEQPAGGEVLICCSRPTGDLVLDL